MVATLPHPPRAYRISRPRAWMVAIITLSLLWPALHLIAGELEPVSDPPAADTLGIVDLDGQVHHLDDYSGQVVLVNFWATWCPPCVAEMPSLQRLYTALSGQPFALLAISMGEGERKIEHFKTTNGIDFPLLVDKSSDLSHRWGVDYLPTSVLIDAKGRVRYKAYGEVDWDEDGVRTILRTLLDEADPRPASAD